MQRVRQAVDAAASLFEQARRHLAGRDVDEAQMEVFDLALCWAEIEAARAAIDALDDGAAAQDEFAAALTRHFCADAVATLIARLRSRPSAFGVSSRSIDADSARFVDATLAPAAIAELGEAVRRRKGRGADDDLRGVHAMMRDTFRRFAEERVMPVAQRIHRQDAMIPDAIIDGLRDLGCFGLSVPERYGGLKPDDGDDSLGMVIVTEELSRGSLGAAGSLITRPEIMARAVLEGGTEEQKARWLPRVAAGDPLVAVAVTEPDTGSDVASVALRAVPASRQGEQGWVLNGTKTWCTFAGKAGFVLVLARTDVDAQPPHRGLSLFVVEKPSTSEREFAYQGPRGGAVSGRAIATIGYRGMHSFEVFFDDYFLPGGALVGEEGGRNRGFYHTMRGFAGGRLQTAARACGLMRAACERAVAHAEQRVVFNRPLASYPLTLQKLARMAATIHVCQRFTRAVAGLMDRGEGQLQASLVKLLACRAAEWVTREAVQIHGGMGYAEETDASRYFLDARVLPIFEGAEETLALKVVGKALLG